MLNVPKIAACSRNDALISDDEMGLRPSWGRRFTASAERFLPAPVMPMMMPVIVVPQDDANKETRE